MLRVADLRAVTGVSVEVLVFLEGARCETKSIALHHSAQPRIKPDLRLVWGWGCRGGGSIGLYDCSFASCLEVDTYLQLRGCRGHKHITPTHQHVT